MKLLLVAAALAAPAALAAQALPAAYGSGSKTVLSGGLSYYQQDYGKRQIAGGFTTLDIHPHWRYGIEGEARVLHLHTSQQVTQSTYLGGLRVNMTMRPARLQPYIKVLAGVGRITLPYNYARGNFQTVAAGGGLDYEVNDRVILRIVDVEAQRWISFPFGTLQPYGISSGISIRLTGVPRYPDARAGRKPR